MNSANKVALLAKILVWVPQFRIIRLNKLSILLFKIRLKIEQFLFKQLCMQKKINQLFDMV